MMKSIVAHGLTNSFAVTALAAIVAPVQANEVLAGHDLWTTPPGGAVEDFGGGNTPDPNDDAPPIPPSFFDPGSDPFLGQVDFVGVPIPLFLGQPTGGADTIVERLTDTNFGTGTTDTIQIELVALSLTSIAPITVTYGGTNPELWDISVSTSGAPSLGSMTITHDQPEISPVASTEGWWFDEDPHPQFSKQIP